MNEYNNPSFATMFQCALLTRVSQHGRRIVVLIHCYMRNRMHSPIINIIKKHKNKLPGMSPRANYTDRATAASRRTGYQLLRIKGATWSA
jgi:hypothetical protein